MYWCGMFSYLSLIKNSEIKFPVEVTQGDCNQMLAGSYTAFGEIQATWQMPGTSIFGQNYFVIKIPLVVIL